MVLGLRAIGLLEREEILLGEQEPGLGAPVTGVGARGAAEARELVERVLPLGRLGHEG